MHGCGRTTKRSRKIFYKFFYPLTLNLVEGSSGIIVSFGPARAKLVEGLYKQKIWSCAEGTNIQKKEKANQSKAGICQDKIYLAVPTRRSLPSLIARISEDWVQDSP